MSLMFIERLVRTLLVVFSVCTLLWVLAEPLSFYLHAEKLQGTVLTIKIVREGSGYGGRGTSTLSALPLFQYQINGNRAFGSCFSPAGNDNKTIINWQSKVNRFQEKTSLGATVDVWVVSGAEPMACLDRSLPWAKLALSSFIVVACFALALSPNSPLR